jgi:hypothetical protein
VSQAGLERLGSSDPSASSWVHRCTPLSVFQLAKLSLGARALLAGSP